MYIKKKLIAISAVLAIAASFAACSDNGTSSTSGRSAENNVNNAILADHETLSQEEVDEITKHDLSIEPFVPEVEQDAYESDEGLFGNNDGGNAAGDNNNNDGGNAAGDNNNNAGGNAAGDNNNAGGNAAGNNNNNPGGNAAGDNNNAGGNAAGNNNNNAGGNQSGNAAGGNIGSNNVDIPKDTGLKVINGTPVIMQAYWMDLSNRANYVYNGEYLLAQFKIKENAADGIYPVTLNKLDFANWESEPVSFTGIDGAVVVGGEAEENKFNDDDTPQVMVSNVSGKPGETVTVAIHIQNNPGVIANILRFSYNSDALEYVGGGEGADFNGHFQ